MKSKKDGLLIVLFVIIIVIGRFTYRVSKSLSVVDLLYPERMDSYLGIKYGSPYRACLYYGYDRLGNYLIR